MPKKRRPEYERELRLELMGQVSKVGAVVSQPGTGALSSTEL